MNEVFVERVCLNIYIYISIAMRLINAFYSEEILYEVLTNRQILNMPITIIACCFPEAPDVKKCKEKRKIA